MIRNIWLVFLVGCAGAPAFEEGPLDRLIARSNAYTSFHLHGEISDGRRSVPVEMAFKAPDRALLKYGSGLPFTGWKSWSSYWGFRCRPRPSGRS